MSNINEMFEEDAGALTVNDEQLSGIGGLAKRAKLLEKEIEEIESVVKERKEQLSKLLEDTIPAALSELGMKSFKMEDGSSIEVKPFYSATIKDANRAAAYEWLREHNFDDIIKNTVSVRFGRGEDELCDGLLNLLREKNYPVEQAQKIEPQTLKAFVREQIERGSELPMEMFGVYVGSKATIKSA
jgi:CRISPR/Cas system-associated protein Csm6